MLLVNICNDIYHDYNIVIFLVEYEGLVNEVKVQVIQENNKKPFLGGFRHCLTGVEYHNASIQTVAKKRLPPNVCHSLCSINDYEDIDLYSTIFSDFSQLL